MTRIKPHTKDFGGGVKQGGQDVLMSMGQKAQSIMEYVALLAIVSTALLSMQIYFKQGTQAVIRGFADYMGSQRAGTSENDYDYLWFYQGTKGVKSISRIESSEDRNTNTTLGRDSVSYTTDNSVSQSGLADWSVGIERARAGVLPGDGS